MSLLPVGFGASGGEYTIDDSLRFRSSASAFLNRTNTATPTSTTIWTCSFWIKRGTLGTNQYILNAGPFNSGNDFEGFYFMSNDTLRVQLTRGNSQISDYRTNALFRDSSAWYHFVIARNGQAYVVYVNGVAQTFGTSTFGSNPASYVNAATPHEIGNRLDGLQYFDGYITEFNCIDGQALAPTDFGEFDDNGTWKPLAYTGTYGTNGFYLNGVGVTDQSGNGNNWTNNNLNLSTSTATTYDQMKDTPSLVDENAGNFATWNPLRKGTNVAVSEANLKAITSATVAQSVAGTIGMSSGKWYWEVINQGGFLSYTGIVDSTHDMGTYIGSSSTGSGYAYNTAGQKVGPTSGTAVSYGASYTTNDVIGIALDMDAGTLVFYKNGVSQGTAFSSITGTWFAAVSGNGVAGKGGIVNFGQRPFAYTPPTGFLKLNTFNLPDSTIEDGSDYFNTVLYTGTGFGSIQNVTGVGFQPDLVWTKARSFSTSHEFYDVIRGVSKPLLSNTNLAELSWSPYGLVSFDSDGFGVNDLDVNGYGINELNRSYVGWSWKANGSGVSNTVGNIPSTVSANTTAGFSIVSYTGTNSNSTVGHGLGVAPSMVICKNRTTGIGSGSWPVWHTGLSSGSSYIFLNSTAAQASGNNNFTAAPTSTVLNLGTSDTNNTATMIAYCFAEIPGYSAFGSYTGNGSTDGPFVYTGFRPAFVIFKSSNQATNWMMFDATVNPVNEAKSQLWPNLANAENTNSVGIDFLSNGIKLRGALTATNAATSYNYIYMAFAENPFKNALAR